MAILNRVLFLTDPENMGWPLACAAVIGVVAWRNHDPRSIAILLGGSTLAFIVPFFFRHASIRNFPAVKIGLERGVMAVVAGAVLSGVFGYSSIGGLVFAVYCAFIVGVLFWSASDPMFEMITWLAFPTECGRLPDEIHLVDQRRISWPGRPGLVQCHLFKFRYDDGWDYGITGPITFSLFGEDFEGKSPEEIYATYAVWYDQEGVRDMLDEELEGND